MRVGWLVVLVASVVLVVGGIAVNSATEQERRDERDEGLGAATALSVAHVDSELGRVASVLETAPPGVAPSRLADLLGADINVCSAAPTQRCAADEPMATDALTRRAITAARESPTPVVLGPAGDSTDGVVVVAHASRSQTFVAHIATRYLLAANSALIPERPFNTPRLVDDSLARVESGPYTLAGHRVFALPISTTFHDGTRYVVASAPDVALQSSAQRLAFWLSVSVGVAMFCLSSAVLVMHQRRLSRHAVTDDLTGLLARREFERLAGAALDDATRGHSHAALIFIDLDQFKVVNDEIGHHAGDATLQAIARELTGVVRDSDIVGRWGGDEFAMLLPGASSATAMRRAVDIEAALAAMAPVDGRLDGRRVSASVGVAVFPEHGSHLDDLMRSADAAMYEAKRAGAVAGLAGADARDDAPVGTNTGSR